MLAQQFNDIKTTSSFDANVLIGLCSGFYAGVVGVLALTLALFEVLSSPAKHDPKAEDTASQLAVRMTPSELQ